MADANSSYDAQHAIKIGRRPQEMKYLWFEEPSLREDLSETKRVIDVVQPDLNYNGGFTRAAKLARMAHKANMWICPHDTQTGAATVNILQFAATTPNIGPYMEYVSRGKPKPEPW